MHNDRRCGAEVGGGGTRIGHADQELIGPGLLWRGGPQQDVVVQQGGSLQAESALTVP